MPLDFPARLAEVGQTVGDMCGRPLRSKRNLQERCGPWSGADMCAAFDAAHTPQARMGVRGSGPIQAHALEALVAKLVFLIRSLDRAPSLSCDLPTPRQPRGRDGTYTAATGARSAYLGNPGQEVKREQTGVLRHRRPQPVEVMARV